MACLAKDSDAISPRGRLLKLDRKRAKLEAEMKALVDDLSSPGINGEPPAGILSITDIDAQGFPRHDIDLYATRTKRQRLNVLKNDLKALMATLEATLHELHSSSETSSGSGGESYTTVAPVQAALHTEPFCMVHEVLQDSPASNAGLHTGDHVLSFGSIHAGNHRNLGALAEVVRDSVGKTIRVSVFRGVECKAVSLDVTPKPWAGRGVLGCHFLPM